MLLLGENFLLVAGVILLLLWVFLYQVILFAVTLYGYGPLFFNRAEWTGASRSRWFQTAPWWRCCKRCYRHKTIFHDDDEGETPSRRSVIYAAYPHGVNVVSVLFAFMTEASDSTWDRLRRPFVSVYNPMFSIPGIREIYLALGAVRVDRAAMEALLTQGESLVVVPDGLLGAATPFKFWDTHRRPMGFLHLWREHAAHVDLRYVWLEGEEEAYITCCRNARCRIWLMERFQAALTPYLGAIPWRRLRTHISPPFAFVPGETLAETIVRWDVFCKACNDTWIKDKRE